MARKKKTEIALPKLGTVNRAGQRVYSDEDRYIALAAVDLNGGNVFRTAQALGVPAQTLRDWDQARKANPDEFTPPVREKRGDLAAKAEAKAHEIVESITPTDIAKATLSQRAVAFGIFVDKTRTLRTVGLDPDPDAELCRLLDLNRGQLPEHVDFAELGPVIDLAPEPVQVGITNNNQPLFLHAGQLFVQDDTGNLVAFAPPEPTYTIDTIEQLTVPGPTQLNAASTEWASSPTQNQPAFGDDKNCPPMTCSITGSSCQQTLAFLQPHSKSAQPLICSDCSILHSDPHLALVFAAIPSHHSPACSFNNPNSQNPRCSCGLADRLKISPETAETILNLNHVAETAASDIISASKAIAAKTLKTLRKSLGSNPLGFIFSCNNCNYEEFGPARTPFPCPSCAQGVVSQTQQSLERGQQGASVRAKDDSELLEDLSDDDLSN